MPSFLSFLMNNVIRRNIFRCIFLTFITFGLYGLYWKCCITASLEAIADTDIKGPDGALMIFLTVITLGLYNCFWYLQQERRMTKITGKAKLYASRYFLFSLMGLSVVNYACMQYIINKFV